MSIEVEIFDNNTENHILKEVFLNEVITKKIGDFYDLVNQTNEINLGKNHDFLSKFYSKLGFVKENAIGENVAYEIMLMFFGTGILQKKDIEEKLINYAFNIDQYRNLDIDVKGSILYLIEVIIQRKVNIEDEFYDFFMNNEKEKEMLILLVVELIIECLDLLEIDIKKSLDSYNVFFDKYFNYNANFLSEKELDFFRISFHEMIENLYLYITEKEDYKEFILKIEQRIKDNINSNK